MLHNTDSATGVAVTSAPGLFYVAWAFVAGLTVEKWVSAATLVFILLQIFFLLRKELRSRRPHKVSK